MPKSFDDETIVDAVYEAAAVPELWPGVLDQLSTIPEAVGGVLFATNTVDTRGVTSGSLAQLFERFVREGWAEKNTRPTRLAAMNYAGFVSDLDVFTREELDKDPVYAFYRENGIGWAAGTLFQMPSGDLLVFSFERSFERGPVERAVTERLDRLRPHLGRAGLLAWRLGLRRAQAMAQALEVVGLPAAVLRNNGRIFAVNPSLERLIPSVLQDRRDRAALVNPLADQLFGQALVQLGAGLSGETAFSIPLPAAGGQPPMVVHLLPVKGAANDVFAQATAILLVTPVDRTKVATAEVLQGLFDLTPAEARVARAVAQGQTVAEIAPLSGITEGTVRGHLKMVLAKTGLHRQTDLAALLAGSALP